MASRRDVDQGTDAEYKSLRDAVLGSGLPLQAAVGEVFTRVDLLDKGSYEVLRPGSERAEEADRWGIRTFTLPGDVTLTHQVFAECKYAAGRWVFWDAPQNVIRRSHNALIAPPNFVRRPHADAWFNGEPVVSEGVALHEPKKGRYKADPMRIRNAMRQVLIAMGHNLAWEVSSDLRGEPVEDVVVLYHPIVVTTAELYQVRPQRGLKAIENATENLEEVGSDGARTPLLEPIRWANVAFGPPPYLADAYRRMLSDRAESEKLYHGPIDEASLEEAARRHLRGIPTRCYVAQVDYLDEFLRKILLESETAFETLASTTVERQKAKDAGTR